MLRGKSLVHWAKLGWTMDSRTPGSSCIYGVQSMCAYVCMCVVLLSLSDHPFRTLWVPTVIGRVHMKLQS